MTKRTKRARILLRRAMRAVRRHSFSVLSGAVLAVALAVALTDGNFRGAVQSDAAVISKTDEPPGRFALPTPAPQTGSVIYYIVESAQQMDALGSVRRGETIYRNYEGAPPQPPTEVYYLIFDSPEQEAAGARLIAHVAEMAPLEGFDLTVIDLTR